MNNDANLPGFEGMTEQQDLPAGRFSSWLRGIRSALVKKSGVAVECGECNACCTSSYFIHIRPEETQVLTRIAKKFLFAAPGMPKGHVLLGYYENGHCPMLIDDACSIYEHRPITCRNYDCRIFTAAGIAAGNNDKALITRRVRRWKFSYPVKRDRNQHLAVQAAAKFIQAHSECFPAGVVPSNPSQLAILALKVYRVFFKGNDESGKIGQGFSEIEVVRAIIKANKKFVPI